jgi:hypothetical protein
MLAGKGIFPGKRFGCGEESVLTWGPAFGKEVFKSCELERTAEG